MLNLNLDGLTNRNEIFMMADKGKVMKWNKKFIYPTSTRALIDGKRHYDVGTNEKLPSVTTILSATQSEEKRKSLEAWKATNGCTASR